MLFNSFTFIIFFAVVLCVHWLPLPWWWRKLNLLVASYLFYAAWNPPFVIFLWISTLVDWFAAKGIARASSQLGRRAMLMVSLSTNLGMLGFFKYSEALLEEFTELSQWLGIPYEPPSFDWDIVLPLGISFYTFQTLSYTIDVYRGRLDPWSSLLDFSLFVSFFPQLVAGPILRAGQFLPQCTTPKRANGNELFRVPLPKNYVQGLDVQMRDFAEGKNSYLRGEWADHGWWYYYLYALAIKEPLGTWCLVALAMGVTVFGCSYSVSWRDEMVALAPFIAIVIFVSSRSGFSLHSCYVIPALPFLYIWTSKVTRIFEMRPFTRRRLAIAAMVVLALTWSVGSSMTIYRHSLPYFNVLATMLPTPSDGSYRKPMGGSGENTGIVSQIRHALAAGPRNGPRHLLNSNIDWSQDVFYLKEWLDGHPSVKLDGLDCFGCCPTTLAGIPATPFPVPGHDPNDRKPEHPTEHFGPKPGWYALSLNRIYNRDRQYRYFLKFQPVAMAGYSIYIYHITLHEANRVRRELGLSELNRSDGHSVSKVSHPLVTLPPLL